MNLTDRMNDFDWTYGANLVESRQTISSLGHISMAELLELDHHLIDLDDWKTVLLNPVQQFLDVPGKSIRRDFVELGWQLVWLNLLNKNEFKEATQLKNSIPKCPDELAFLVELLHAGSLIIDDIEDDSHTRRGVDCLHRRIGLAPALNIGNWLYFVSAYMIEKFDCDSQTRLTMYQVLNRVMLRCHQGQALDVSFKISELNRRQVSRLVETSTRLKTGVLVGFATQMAALYLGMNPQESQPYYRFGEQIGLALQMYDDLSGIITPRRFHKAHEDFYRERLTWVWSWLAENPLLSDQQYESLIHNLKMISLQTEEIQDGCLGIHHGQ